MLKEYNNLELYAQPKMFFKIKRENNGTSGHKNRKFSQAGLHIQGNTKNSSSDRNKVNLDGNSEVLEDKIDVRVKYMDKFK